MRKKTIKEKNNLKKMLINIFLILLLALDAPFIIILYLNEQYLSDAQKILGLLIFMIVIFLVFICLSANNLSPNKDQRTSKEIINYFDASRYLDEEK